MSIARRPHPLARLSSAAIAHVVDGHATDEPSHRFATISDAVLGAVEAAPARSSFFVQPVGNPRDESRQHDRSDEAPAGDDARPEDCE